MRLMHEDYEAFEEFEFCDSRAMTRLRNEQRREENRLRVRKNLSRARGYLDRDQFEPSSRAR